jgi:hypothetical protein
MSKKVEMNDQEERVGRILTEGKVGSSILRIMEIIEPGIVLAYRVDANDRDGAQWRLKRIEKTGRYDEIFKNGEFTTTVGRGKKREGRYYFAIEEERVEKEWDIIGLLHFCIEQMNSLNTFAKLSKEIWNAKRVRHWRRIGIAPIERYGNMNGNALITPYKEEC